MHMCLSADFLRILLEDPKNKSSDRDTVKFIGCSYILLVILRSGIVRYTDPAGKERTYEMVERVTRCEAIGVDGTDIIGKIHT